MLNYADIKLLRGKVEDAIEAEKDTILASDDDHTSARAIIAELPLVLSNMRFGELPTPEHIARVALTACKDVQFRDFLMGLFTEEDSTTVGAYLEIVAGATKKDYAYPVFSVLATYYYRDGNKDEAQEMVQEVLNLKPEYSLAQLLSRVFPVAGNDMFTQMAGELHPRVKAVIFEEETK